MSRERLQSGDDLHRRGTGADHGYPLTAKVVVVVPVRGVEHLTTKRFEPGKVGCGGGTERAGGRDQELCLPHGFRSVYPPDLGLLVPRSFCHVLVAVEMTGQSEAMDAIPEIVVDLGL